MYRDRNCLVLLLLFIVWFYYCSLLFDFIIVLCHFFFTICCFYVSDCFLGVLQFYSGCVLQVCCAIVIALLTEYMVVDTEFMWMVPIDIASSTDPTKPIHSTVLDSKTTSITLENVKADDWIKVSNVECVVVSPLPN